MISECSARDSAVVILTGGSLLRSGSSPDLFYILSVLYSKLMKPKRPQQFASSKVFKRINKTPAKNNY